MDLPFGEWLPDAPKYNNPGMPTVCNVYPGPGAYKPVGDLTPVSSALDAYARAAITTRDKDRNVRQYAGNASKLYELVSTTWTDRSKVGGYSTSTEERWELLRWKNKLLAVNYDDNPQSITFGDPAFADLTTAFRARHIWAVGDRVVVGNTYDATDGEQHDRVRWCAADDETDWTISAATGADKRDLGVGGHIQRGISGDVGVIISEKSVFRQQYVGGETWFQIDQTLDEIGAIAPGAVVNFKDHIFIWSRQGFYVVTGRGTNAQPIGANKVDKFARADLDQSYIHRISSVIDPTLGRVAWAYPGSGNTDGIPNKILIYDFTLNQWSIIEKELDILYAAGGVAFTLEDLDAFGDLDSLPASLDSERWKGEGQLFAAFDTDHKSGYFDGSNLEAEFHLPEIQPIPGRRSRLGPIIPQIDGGAVTAKVATRLALQHTQTETGTLTQHAEGKIYPRVESRYHQVKITATGQWTDAVGVEIDGAAPGGRR